MEGIAPAAIDRMPGPRRAILIHLKANQPQRAEDLAAALQVTVSGIRQQLATLTAESLVAYKILRGQPGRPKFLYHLTAQGDALFPREYATLTNEILQFFDHEEPDLVRRLFERRTDKRLERIAPRMDGKSLRERIDEVVAVLDADGFMAVVEEDEDGALRIVERNCSVREVARVETRLCSSELDFIQRALPDTIVERTHHAIAGDAVCSYSITPLNTSG